jgi:acetyl-CoA carboxylase carboxyl transferase subunit alpha
LIDEIVPEPEGGAHLDHDATAKLLDSALTRALDDVSKLPIKDLLEARYVKFRQMGLFF